MTWTGYMCISSADASRDLEKKNKLCELHAQGGWDIDVNVCMFTEFCKWHFNVKLFNYIFDTLFSIFFELLWIASILLDPIFTGNIDVACRERSWICKQKIRNIMQHMQQFTRLTQIFRFYSILFEPVRFNNIYFDLVISTFHWRWLILWFVNPAQPNLRFKL